METAWSGREDLGSDLHRDRRYIFSDDADLQRGGESEPKPRILPRFAGTLS